MAISPIQPRASDPRARQRGSSLGKRWMSERQLDAYFEARDTLRRLRAVASLAPDLPRRTSSTPSPT
jgi:hypothetical protein